MTALALALGEEPSPVHSTPWTGRRSREYRAGRREGPGSKLLPEVKGGQSNSMMPGSSMHRCVSEACTAVRCQVRDPLPPESSAQDCAMASMRHSLLVGAKRHAVVCVGAPEPAAVPGVSVQCVREPRGLGAGTLARRAPCRRGSVPGRRSPARRAPETSRATRSRRLLPRPPDPCRRSSRPRPSAADRAGRRWCRASDRAQRVFVHGRVLRGDAGTL